MADRHQTQRHSQTRSTTTTNPAASFLHKRHQNTPNSAQLMGFMTLIISGLILLLLTGLTVTATVVVLIFLTPLIILSSPVWFPIAVLFSICAAVFFSLCGIGGATVAVLSWLYRYFKGLNPPGSDRVDYARNRIYDTASHVKDYAREYGGYLHTKAKDAAPGA
ncbi:hypothetical protein UlMin_008482 [Ulmus minor]